MILEACVETIEEAITAERSGATQIELCSHLEHDGLSPTLEMVKGVKESIDIPIKVMVRPRKGDFQYTYVEVDKMIEYARQLRSIGITSIVTGMLNPDNTIDIDQLTRLANAIPDIQITFHKAIDLVDDPISEIYKLESIPNVTGILTSGKESTAMEGLGLLRQLIHIHGKRFTIIAAGKITSDNLEELHRQLLGNAYHGRRIVK